MYTRMIFANSNMPEKRFLICLSENETSLLPDDLTDILKRNMLVRQTESITCKWKESVFLLFLLCRIFQVLHLAQTKMVNKND